MDTKDIQKYVCESVGHINGVDFLIGGCILDGMKNGFTSLTLQRIVGNAWVSWKKATILTLLFFTISLHIYPQICP